MKDFELGGRPVDILRQLIAEMEAGKAQQPPSPVAQAMELLDSYDEMMEELRPAFTAGSAISKKVVEDFAPVFAAVLSFINDTIERPELQAERQRLVTNRAKSNMSIYKAYIAEGFSEAQAMTLLSIHASAANPITAGIQSALQARGTSTK